MTSVPLVTTATVHSPRPRIVLDPRTVLVHILLIGTVTFSLHTLAATAVFVLLTAAFIAVVASPRGGAAMVVLWVVFAGLRASIGLWAAATPLSLLIPTLTVFVRIGPLMGAGLLFTRALSVSRFVAALERLRVPRAVTVTLAVMLRFTPTIGYELHQIADALRTRGIPLTPLTLLRAPARTAELVVVPLVQRCTTIADELSAAAITRGLERPGTRTTRIPLRFSAADAAYLALLAVATAVVVGVEGGVVR